MNYEQVELNKVANFFFFLSDFEVSFPNCLIFISKKLNQLISLYCLRRNNVTNFLYKIVIPLLVFNMNSRAIELEKINK